MSNFNDLAGVIGPRVKKSDNYGFCNEAAASTLQQLDARDPAAVLLPRMANIGLVDETLRRRRAPPAAGPAGPANDRQRSV